MSAIEISDAAQIRRLNALAYRELDGMSYQQIAVMQRTDRTQASHNTYAGCRIIERIPPAKRLVLQKTLELVFKYYGRT